MKKLLVSGFAFLFVASMALPTEYAQAKPHRKVAKVHKAAKHGKKHKKRH